MAIDIKQLLDEVDLAAVVLARTEVVKVGNEWVGRCPFHNESTPSFKVVPHKGFIKCHGCGWYGDAIDFLREHDGLSFKEACAELGRPLEDTAAVPARPRPPKVADWVSSKPPRGEKLDSLATRGLGEPVRSWEILTEDGALIGYVARYKNPDAPDKKVVLTWSWGKVEGKDEAEHWDKRGFTKPRPLYGLHRLGEARRKRVPPQVVLLEGEGKADSAQALFPGSVGMSWLGGADGVVYCDFTPLKGLQVVLIPDNDDIGRKAVRWLREFLIGLSCDVTVLEPEPTREKGWNMDDAEREGWTSDQAMKWARERKIATAQKAAEVAPLGLVEGSAVRKPEPEEEPEEEELSAAFSEMLLAQRLFATHGEDWRYVHTTGKWLEWRKDGWYVDETQKIKAVSSRSIQWIAGGEEAKRLSQSGQRTLCSSRTVNATVALFSADERIASTANEWDLDPYLLGVPGGTVDLREGKVLEADRDDRITKRCAVAPDAREPTLWLAHLHKALKGQQDVIGFIRRYLGSMLTGDTKEHCLLFFYGQGRNGKGTIVETVVRLLGDYGYSAPANLIMESKTERHPVELAMLRGRRAVSCSEPPQGARWDDGRIRWLTGGDTITARGMGENLSSFEPSHHLLVMGNHKPKLRSVDDATKNRFHMVNFTVNMTLEPDFDKNLPAKLHAEWPRILGWMIRGCLEWQQTGLAPPDSVREATKEYLQAEHIIEQWIDDCCDRDGGMDPVADCYKSYTAWCEKVGEHAKSRRAFLDELYQIPGIEPKATSAARMVKGLTVKALKEPQGPLYP